MNALNISLHEFEIQRNLNNVRPLYPNYHDYERRKHELQKNSLSHREYEIAIQMLAGEFGL